MRVRAYATAVASSPVRHQTGAAYSCAIPGTAQLLRDLLFARPERHRYGPDRSQRADLYLPAGDGPFPVAVAIHGGYWKARYGKRLEKAVAVDLTRRGLAVWNIEYRRLGNGGGWPGTFDDVGAAIDRLATLRHPRLDLSSVTAFGHSAGGQLALWATSRTDGSVRIARVCAQAAVCDLAAAGGAARELMGGTPDDVPERYAQADPVQLAPLGVPILLVHGAEDATVPVTRSRRFAEVARAAGDDVELIEPNPGGHRVHVDPRSEAWTLAAGWIASRKLPER
jgi:dipeptidyl aminopeptidase/acylaminoacyl peptidase